MQLRLTLSMALGAVGLGVAYAWLSALLVGFSYRLAGPGLWLGRSVDVRHGMLLWMESLNTLAIIIAALLVAVMAVAVFRKHALVIVLLAAVAVASFSIGNTLGVLEGARLQSDHMAIILIDSIKTAILPAVLVLMLRRWPSTHWFSRNREL